MTTASITTDHIQTGILAPLPSHATYLRFTLKANSNPRAALEAVARFIDGEHVVLGLGARLIGALGSHVPGLREFAGIPDAKVDLPATPSDLWLWLRASDRGNLALNVQLLQTVLAPAFDLQEALNAFQHDGGRDLTGYEDGTENPQEVAAVHAAIVQNQGAGLNGASFVAVQQWQHDFSSFNQLTSQQQDNAIGRRRTDNEELEDAPESAHVKRTAQEDFSPEAFVLRRSMPWSSQGKAGLQFVAFGKSFDAFEAQLRRMSGAEDGVVDALFSFSAPLTTSYFWCPPMRDERLDLTIFGFGIH
jgi:porphyrinogen peroxidase